MSLLRAAFSWIGCKAATHCALIAASPGASAAFPTFAAADSISGRRAPPVPGCGCEASAAARGQTLLAFRARKGFPVGNIATILRVKT